MISKKYQIILADPPWRYDFSKSAKRKIEKQYPTMSLDEICNLEVPSAENSVLYLWATAPKLPEALKVMKAWGFKYKTNLVWDKKTIGMGYWFRGQHELLLVGVKGKFSPPEATKRISSVFSKQKSIHSRKPDEIVKHIGGWYPDEEKLELFARRKTKGWDAEGNDLDGNDIKESLKKLSGVGESK